MRVGYAKLGQRIVMDAADDWASIGSTRDEPRVLKTLAARNPDWTFFVVGKNDGTEVRPLGFPSNVRNPWAAVRTEFNADVKKVLDRHGTQNGMGYDAKLEVIGLTDRYTADWFRDLDALVIYAGPHGTSNQPIPMVGQRDRYTNPHDQFFTYSAYLTRGIAVWRERDPLKREEVYLVPDARNVLKCRDLKWPHRHPLLGQFDMTYNARHERYGDPRSPAECGFGDVARVREAGVWVSTDTYVYSGLEISGVVPEHMGPVNDEWSGRTNFGMFINEADPRARPSRRDCMLDWVAPLSPDWVHGNWTKTSQAILAPRIGYAIEPAPSSAYYDILRSSHSTFTTPSSGSGWATAKPWEAFAAGTACFFHPDYDTQGHIIPTLDDVTSGGMSDELTVLTRWLRVSDPDELAKRVHHMHTSREAWEWVIRTQRALYDHVWNDLHYARTIEKRIKEGR